MDEKIRQLRLAANKRDREHAARVRAEMETPAAIAEREARFQGRKRKLLRALHSALEKTGRLDSAGHALIRRLYDLD